MTQEQRLDFLIEAFRADLNLNLNLEYKNLGVEAKRRILRSLMNIRMPKSNFYAFDNDEVLKIQDEYLHERIIENGIVTLADINKNKNNKNKKISVWQGDITRLAVDAIVNAANSQMLGCFVPMHTCIDNCIHTFAGVQLRAECERKMSALRAKFGADYEQPVAVPLLTDAYNLPAEKIIHVVGPVVNGVLTPELENQLADCYKNVLDMCAENGIKSVAFCCISTGVFHFPNERAAEIAVGTVFEWLSSHDNINITVIFNVFKDEDRLIYEGLLK